MRKEKESSQCISKSASIKRIEYYANNIASELEIVKNNKESNTVERKRKRVIMVIYISSHVQMQCFLLTEKLSPLMQI